MNDFGKILRELREERRLSQMQLATETGLSQSAIARYELNKTEPRLSDIKVIAEFFHVSTDYLLGLKDE